MIPRGLTPQLPAGSVKSLLISAAAAANAVVYEMGCRDESLGIFHLGAALHSQSAGDVIALRMVARLLLRDLAAVRRKVGGTI